MLLGLIKFISIPTGTIKSAYLSYRKHDYHLFQFLLVRLKDLKNHGYKRLYKRISIPTGTIKSPLPPSLMSF